MNSDFQTYHNMSHFFDFHHYGAVNKNRNLAEKAANRAEKTEQLYEDLLQRHEKMALMCQALLELVQEQTGITNEDLEKKVLEIDLRDGKVDGKMKAQVSKCTTCGRAVSSKRPVCIFCGTESKQAPSF